MQMATMFLFVCLFSCFIKQDINRLGKTGSNYFVMAQYTFFA